MKTLFSNLTKSKELTEELALWEFIDFISIIGNAIDIKEYMGEDIVLLEEMLKHLHEIRYKIANDPKAPGIETTLDDDFTSRYDEAKKIKCFLV